MEHAISMARAREVFSKLKSAQGRLDKIKEHSADFVHRGAIIGLGVGGSFLSGFLNAKMGPGNGQPWQLFGFDVDFGAGAALATAGLVGMGGKHADLLTIFGAGLMGGWGYREGFALEAKLAGPAQATGFVKPASQFAGAIPGQYAQSASQYTGAVSAQQYG